MTIIPIMGRARPVFSPSGEAMSRAAAHLAGEYVPRNTVRSEERLDLIKINRIGQNPGELIRRLRESRPVQDVENMLPRDFHETP